MNNKRLVHEILPSAGNPRNSEGAFLRAKNGDILFAYSRYNGLSDHDNASCDIALLRSSDEGEHWTFDSIIAKAEDFGVSNIMSVSSLVQSDSSLAFYFLIKENDKTSTVGRCISKDGITFSSKDAERCNFIAQKGYYVINNDRISRLSDGRVIFPAAYYPSIDTGTAALGTLLVSHDDGKTIEDGGFYLESAYTINRFTGLQEPGAVETACGIYMWFRTNYGCQYESTCSGLSFDFSTPLPSIFTSPTSPMQIKRIDGIYYAVYNPIPNYNGRTYYPGTAGRTPIVIRKSYDGVNYGPINIIEGADVLRGSDGQNMFMTNLVTDAPNTRGYCYPAIFKANDDYLLIAYCRGDEFLHGDILDSTGIIKIKMASIK